jgi:ligand-binding SRPBCC domain-containing protein
MSRVTIAEDLLVGAPPEDVFAFMSDPAHLAEWQTVKTSVRPLDDGPPRLGLRVHEVSKVGPRRWEQVVEVTEFDPCRAFAVRVVEGPPSQGRWTMEPHEGGTRLHFEAAFEAPGPLAPVMRPVLARQFRGYHRNLRERLEHPPAEGRVPPAAR